MTNTLKSVLALALLTGACAGEDSQSPQNSTAKRQKAVRGANAANTLIALSDAVVDAKSVGNRTSLVADLSGDIEAGISDFIATLENADCLDFTLESLTDSSVHVEFDFDACVTNTGIDGITGDLDIDIETALDTTSFDFDVDLQLDGFDISGDYLIAAAEAGQGAISGALALVLPNGETLTTTLDASFADIGQACPSLTQHFEIEFDGEQIEIDLSGLDLCATSLCESGVTVEIEDLEGVAGVDFDTSIPELDGLDAGLFCSEDGDLGWDPSL